MKSGWEIKPVGELCTFHNGLWIGKKPPYVTAGVFRNTDFGRDGTLKDSELAVLQVEEKQLSTRRLQFGDIILEKSGGGPKQAVGRVAFYDKTEGVHSFSNFTSAIRVNDANHLWPHYLLKFLFWTYLSGVTEGMQSHSTGIRNLNGDAYKQIAVPLPPLDEQRRIVAVLDKAFAGIATAKANAQKNLTHARAVFESHLDSIFAQRGQGWSDTRLGAICDRVSVGHVGQTTEFYCDQSDGVPFLRSQNVRRGQLDWSGIKYITKEFHAKLKKSQLRFGDLLFVRVGANRGDCCSIQDDFGEINCANIVFARPTRGNARFLEWYCQSIQGRMQLLGMTTGSAQGVINTSAVAELVVPLPPFSEQESIVSELESRMAKIDRLECIYRQKIAALDELKQSLLQKAFAGELT